MRKVRIASLISIAVCIVFGWAVGYADINEGLVAYYPFNGNTDDESGYGNHGITDRDYSSSCKYCGNTDIYPEWNGLHAPVLTTDKDGNENSAYDFGSTPDNYVQGMTRDHITVLHDSIMYPTEELTVVAWFTVRKNDPNIIVSCNETGGWRIVTLNNNTIRFTYDVKASHYADESVRWWHEHITYTDETVDFTQTWNKVTATYRATDDGYVAKLYLNGQPVGENSLTGKDAPAPLFIRYDYALAIGGDGCNWDQYAQIKFRAVRHNLDSTNSKLYLNENVFTDGKIDEVRIYNRVIEDAEILDYYNGDTVEDYVVDDDFEMTPDVINVTSKGKYVTAQITFPDGAYDLTEVDVDSVLLLDTLPVLSHKINKEKIIVKFDRQELIDKIVEMDLEYPNEIDVYIFGYFYDGTPFTGEDTLKVKGKN